MLESESEMSAPNAPFDLEKAHKWFAVSCNNEAWDLVEAEQLEGDDAERMIHAAHTACYHWMGVGEKVNQLRALVLLTSAYLKKQQAEPAVHYAEQTVEMLKDCDGVTGFDRACVLGSAMCAYELGEDHEKAEHYRCQAYEAMNDVHEPDEKKVIEDLYNLN